jgi:hypothetical protein
MPETARRFFDKQLDPVQEAAALCDGRPSYLGRRPRHWDGWQNLEPERTAIVGKEQRDGRQSWSRGAEVEARMKQPGQTVPEILQTILLNSIKLKYRANRIDPVRHPNASDQVLIATLIPVEASVEQRIHEVVLSLGSSP